MKKDWVNDLKLQKQNKTKNKEKQNCNQKRQNQWESNITELYQKDTSKGFFYMNEQDK